MMKIPKCSARRRRRVSALLALVLTASAVAATIQVFMYASWVSTIRLPEVRFVTGSDENEVIAGKTAQANISEDGGSAMPYMPTMGHRGISIENLLAVKNFSSTTENLQVGTIVGSFENQLSNPAAMENVENIWVYIGLENTTHQLIAGQVTPSPEKVLLEVVGNTVNYYNWSGTISGNTWRSIGVYVKLGAGFVAGDDFWFEMFVIHLSH